MKPDQMRYSVLDATVGGGGHARAMLENFEKVFFIWD